MARHKHKGNSLPPPLAAVNLHAAGVDIGAKEHWVAVPADSDPQPVRRFGACTADLAALAEWLTACGVTPVAMESTGVYWLPLFELLESRGGAVVLGGGAGRATRARAAQERRAGLSVAAAVAYVWPVGCRLSAPGADLRPA